ncbi:glycosyltransferase family 2 protein [Robertmurraya massiliosenegalensis]|uniref:glycosyltransferase family 2 protein n=1 Tax=Robertmurraya massiliosenegalensis TaxID=1287657 RepID=UPI0003017D4E|nr:glycosyltransferase family 2 protein [Robertmurraya massiliosenegalensis]
MNSPVATVFIPIYNCESYIKETLDSIINQTYNNLEILLINDGSTDNSIDIINQYDDPRIRLLHNPKNMGIPYTRNVGLKEAKGKYLINMDSDDIAFPERVEKQVSFFESHPDIDAIGSNYVKFSDKSKRKIKAKYTSPMAINIMLLFFDPISNPSSAIRLATLRKYNLSYNEEYFVAQDYEFWSQLSKVGKITITPEFLIAYRTGHDNITKKSNREKNEKRKNLIASLRGGLLAHYGVELNESELKVYNDFFVHSYGVIVEEKELLVQTIIKLKKWNKEQNNILNKELFVQILDYCICIGISNQSITIPKKLSLYSSLVSKGKLKDRLYIVVKHLYYRLLLR